MDHCRPPETSDFSIISRCPLLTLSSQWSPFSIHVPFAKKALTSQRVEKGSPIQSRLHCFGIDAFLLAKSYRLIKSAPRREGYILLYRFHHRMDDRMHLNQAIYVVSYPYIMPRDMERYPNFFSPTSSTSLAERHLAPNVTRCRRRVSRIVASN